MALKVFLIDLKRMERIGCSKIVFNRQSKRQAGGIPSDKPIKRFLFRVSMLNWIFLKEGLYSSHKVISSVILEFLTVKLDMRCSIKKSEVDGYYKGG